jgi:hypothetical protein
LDEPWADADLLICERVLGEPVRESDVGVRKLLPPVDVSADLRIVPGQITATVFLYFYIIFILLL